MAQNPLPPDDELIPKLITNDENAYRQIVTAYHGLMVHLARSIVGDAIADEVAQEAWMAVMKSLSRFERRSSLKTWILRIVSNCAKSRLRHESRTVNFDTLDEAAFTLNADRFDANGHWQHPPRGWHADTPDLLLAGDQAKHSINRSLRSLPGPQQAMVTLRDIHGLDMDSICKILEVSESNARVLLHRARSQIRQALEDLEV